MKSPAKPPAPAQQNPCCVAIYDFDPENPGELGFKVNFIKNLMHLHISSFVHFQENDIIQLVNRIDENWYEGKLNGKQGYFPQTYVEVKVPLS
jgi:endophilin-A